MKQSEICRQLIMMAFDPEQADHPITLGDAMDLYRDLIMRETPADGIDEALAAAVTSPLDEIEPYRSIFGLTSQLPATDNVIDTIKGRGSYEKKEIYQRLIDYRSKHGLGSLKDVADASNGITETDLRLMMNGTKYPLIKWQMVGDALDKLEENTDG